MPAVREISFVFSCSLVLRKRSLGDITGAHGEFLERFLIGVEKPRAKIGGSAAIDDGAADDVDSLFEREALRDAVIDNGLAVAIDADDLLAVDPPDGRRIRADGQPHAGFLLRTID